MATLNFTFLGKFLSKHSILIVSILCGIFIYNRTLDYYKVIPRHNLLSAFFIIIWTFISLKYCVWFIPLGLIILNIYDEVLSKTIIP